MPHKLAVDLDAVCNGLKVYWIPGSVYEIRILSDQATYSGFFDDLEKAAAAIKSQNDGNVYVSMNPVLDDLLSRSCNRIQRVQKRGGLSATDRDIQARRRLVWDFDPVRVKGVSSTDDELGAAISKAEETSLLMQKELAWPEPSLILSGNGVHLSWEIALPNDEPAKALCEKVLKAAGARFSDARVSLDTALFNASRIIKVPGTIARKGDNTSTRPHRLSEVLSVPETGPVTLTRERLEAFAAIIPEAETNGSKRTAPDVAAPGNNSHGFDVEAFLRKHGIEYEGPEEIAGGGRKFILKHCAFNETHDGTSAAVFQLPDGKLGYRCLHNSCECNHWQEFRAKVEGPTRNEAPSEKRTSLLIQDRLAEPALSEESNWPAALAQEAYYGITGDILRAVEPHTEADPAAILVQLLCGFGSLLGRSAFSRAEADAHHTNLFAVLVGQSSRGRKGTSWSVVRTLLSEVDPVWAQKRVKSGLGSGEGLIYNIRDRIEKQEPIRDGKNVTGYQTVVTDPGIEDKRILVIEPEFSKLLKVCERKDSTLSAIVRESFDTGTLCNLVKNLPLEATGAHVSILGHITQDELRRELSDTATANGFANRFLWVCVQRSKLLPEGGAMQAVDTSPLVARLIKARDFGRRAGELKRDTAARSLWRDVYPELTADRGQGLLNAVTSRAEALVLRLETLYAVLDCATEKRPEHLMAAMAVWEYSEASARFLFGESMGDTVADEILSQLRRTPEGLTRSELTDYFHRNRRAADIERDLHLLQKAGRARVTTDQTSGRPAERWFAL